MAEQTSFVWRTFTNVTGHAVMTSTSIETWLLCTIVDIYFAVVSFVAINANTGVAAFGIVTSGTVLAHIRPQGTFVDVFSTIPTSVLSRTIASVSSNSVDATASILA